MQIFENMSTSLSVYLKAQTGRTTALARFLGIRPSAVIAFCNGDTKIPIKRCPQIEAWTDGAVCCEEIRPDANWQQLRQVMSLREYGKRVRYE